MTCSRSARRQSVTKDRSTSPRPRRSDAVSMAVNWSSKSCRVSNRSRPMRVLFPSSTDPMVANRRRSMVSTPSSGPPAGGEPGNVVMGLEIPLTLAVLHGGLREAVVSPRGTALGDPRRRDLTDDLLHRVGVGAHGARAGGVADRTEAHRLLADFLPGVRAHPLAEGQEYAVALDDFPLVGVVDGWQLDAFTPDVLPDIELGPVGKGKGAQVLAGADAALVELPQLGSLCFGIPLPERIPEGQDPFLGSCLVLVPAGATEGRVEPVGVDGVEQRRRLQPIARTDRARIGDPALVDGILHARHNESGSFGLDLGVPVFEHLREVVSRVDVEDRNADLPGL